MNDTLAIIVVGVLVFLVWQSRQEAAAGGSSGAPDPRLADGSRPSTFDAAALATTGCQALAASQGASYAAPLCKYNSLTWVINHKGEIAAAAKKAAHYAVVGAESAAKAPFVAGSFVASHAVKPVISGVASGVKSATNAVSSGVSTVLGWL